MMSIWSVRLPKTPDMHIYLLLINLTAFALMFADKSKARRGNRRIPEKVLFLSALAGGSIGAIGGMLACRHKTRHLSFVLGLPSILLLQLAIGFWLTR